MRINLESLGALLFLMVMAGTLPPAAHTQEPAPAGDSDNGKQLYNSIGCWQCHGYSAQGGNGPKLAPDPVSYPYFSGYVRKPSGSMPPYSPKVVSDQSLADIYAFLLTIPKPPDPDSIPLLKGEKSE